MSFRGTPKKPSEADFIGAVTSRPDIRLFLIFGPDESAAADIAARMSTAIGADAERIDLDSDRLRSDPAALADEATSLSLFGGARYIRTQVRREEGQAAFENLLNADRGGCPVIAVAGDLKKTSKLRKLAESSTLAMTHICYTPNEGDAASNVMAMANAAGLRLDRALALRISRYTGQDRKLAAMEIDKLALYYDAAPNRQAIVEIAAFEALSAETGEENVQDLINKVMSGNIRGLGTELMQARQMGMDAIRIIRALQRRVALLIGLRGKVDNGAVPGALVRGTPSVFFQEKDAVITQLTCWPSARLAGLNGHLLDIENCLMQVKAEIGSVILEQELTKITRAAARTR
jgi:DNA polymerase III subunit delta